MCVFFFLLFFYLLVNKVDQNPNRQYKLKHEYSLLVGALSIVAYWCGYLWCADSVDVVALLSGANPKPMSDDQLFLGR